MQKIGLLYLCTGPYIAFWEDFFHTSETYFLKEYEKHYFVFSDQPVNTFGTDDRIHYKHIDNMPWPLITLMRYHYFMSIADALEKMDYLMFSNANMKFVDYVTAEEFLPREKNGEDIFVVAHPGYINQPSYQAPFERSSKSKAYVPYNYRDKYVIGAMNGGTAQGFLKMSETIIRNTNEDLKKNCIAKWHDESQLNHYISKYQNYRLLSPSYCYPFGIDLPIKKKIVAVSKQAKFDVKTFKGQDVENRTIMDKILWKTQVYLIRLANCLCFIRDSFLRK